MEALHRALGRAEVVIAATFLVLMVVLIFTGGVARMLHHPLNWTTDFATCLFAWACFLAADIAWRNDALMSIELVTRRLPPTWRDAVVRLNYRLISAFLVYVVVAGTHLAWISRARSFQGIPEISYSWVTASLPAGALLLLFTTVLKFRALGRERVTA